jgi:hypothetical protein
MEWIKVENKSPEDRQEVLIFLCGEVYKAWYNLDLDLYQDEDLDQHPETNVGLSHWMPLPEPPKE